MPQVLKDCLFLTPAMVTVLAPFFAFQRRFQIYPKIAHIPGHLNDIADALSRFKQLLPEPLTLSDQCVVRWQKLLESDSIFIAQTGRKWPYRFCVGEKWFLQSPLTQGVLKFNVLVSFMFYWVLSDLCFPWNILDQAGLQSSLRLMRYSCFKKPTHPTPCLILWGPIGYLFLYSVWCMLPYRWSCLTS